MLKHVLNSIKQLLTFQVSQSGFSWCCWPAWFGRGKQALFLVQPETDLALASGAFPLILEAQIKGACEQAKTLTRDDQLDQADGNTQPASSELRVSKRIRGELLKLDIRVSKRTIQKYMSQVRRTTPRGQNWKTFLRNHAAEVRGVRGVRGVFH